MSACLSSSLEAGLHGQALGTQILRHHAPLLQGEVVAVADLDLASRSRALHRKSHCSGPQRGTVLSWLCAPVAQGREELMDLTGQAKLESPAWVVFLP